LIAVNTRAFIDDQLLILEADSALLFFDATARFVRLPGRCLTIGACYVSPV